MRTRKSPQERRNEILDVAQRLFAAEGYSQVQVEDMLKASGLSRGGFYHHFKSKADVLEGLIERETIELAATATSNSEGVFHGLLVAGSRYRGANPGVLDTLSRSPDVADYLHFAESAQRRHLCGPLSEAVQSAIDAGRYEPSPPEHVADLFLAVNARINRMRLTGQWTDAEALAYSRTALRAIGALLGAQDEFLNLANALQTGKGGDQI